MHIVLSFLFFSKKERIRKERCKKCGSKRFFFALLFLSLSLDASSSKEGRDRKKTSLNNRTDSSMLLLPRALAPASSLEPLIDDDERLLRSFERVAVASSGSIDDEGMSDDVDDGGCNVGTLHVTSR